MNITYYETDKSNNFRELLQNLEKTYDVRDLFREKEGDGIRSTTVPQFRNLAYHLGAGLNTLGLLDGKIALIGETSVKWVASYFATVCGGSVIVPIDKELPENEIANIINDSGSAAVIYSATFEDVMHSIELAVPHVKYFIGMGASQENGKYLSYDKLVQTGMDAGTQAYLARDASGDVLSSLLYTSGTTGKSKGVMLTQKSILRAAQGGQALMRAGKSYLSVLPIHHSYEFANGMLMQIVQGCTVCINDSPRYFLQNLQLFQPEQLVLVPAYVEMIYKKIWANAKAQGSEEQLKAAIAKSNELLEQGIDKRAEFFSSIKDALGGKLKLILCGGAPLSPSYVKAFRDLGILFLQGYGITECSPLVSVNGNENYKDDSIGPVHPFCKVEIRNADEEGEGEIWVKGENVMLGYYQNPEATAQVMDADGWFNTEDIGHLDEDGFLYITGRKKNLIILSNGKNVYPEEVEEYLLRIPYVKEVVVYTAAAEDGGEEKLTAEIFADETYSAEHSPEEILRNLENDIAEVNKGLPGFKQVHNFHTRDTEFEKTTKKSIKRFTVGK